MTGNAGDPNAVNATMIAYYLNSLPNYSTVIFLTAPYLYADFGTLRFISPQQTRITIANPLEYDVKNDNTYQKNKHLIYIIYPQYKSKLEDIKRIYPNGSNIEFDVNRNLTPFYIYNTNNESFNVFPFE